MNDIQNIAIETYHNNMIYLRQNFPELYKKIETLEYAIQNGKYKEKFSLEFRSEGFFDIFDQESGQWLYGSSSIEHAKKMAKKINYSKTKGTIETYYNFVFDEKSLDLAERSDATTSRFVTMAPIIDYLAPIIDKKNTTMKVIYKMIFFGVGLGLHIEEISKKFGTHIHLIIEDNLEIFRLSLFVTNYAAIGERSDLYFAIMETSDKFKKTFEEFFHNSFIRNNYIKYSLFYNNYISKIHQIQNFIVTMSHLTYTHDMLLRKNIRVLKRIKEKWPFLELNNLSSGTPFQGKNVVLVAAGPSLDKNIHWLKSQKDNLVIVALFAVSHILEKEGIIPDIIIHIDEKTYPIELEFERMADPETFFKQAVFLMAPSVDLDSFGDVVKKERCFFFEDRTRYHFECGCLEGYSAGDVALALTLLMKAKNIYLLGLDLALDPESGRSHSQDHISAKVIENDNQCDNIVSLKETKFKVPGNFRKEVETTPIFDMSIHRVNYFITTLKQKDQLIFNLNDGAKFADTIPVGPEKVCLKQAIDKNGFMDAIIDFFNKNSRTTLSEKEQEYFNERITEVTKKKEMIKAFMKVHESRLDMFQNSFVDLSSRLIVEENPKSNELSQILLIFLENVGGYFGDFFNTKEIQNPKRHIRRLQKIYGEQILKILNAYENALIKKTNAQ